MTNGRGTYVQGTLESIETVELERSEFEDLLTVLSERGMWALEPRFATGEYEGSLRESSDSDDEIISCRHSSFLILEATASGEQMRSYRSACGDEWEDLRAAVAPVFALLKDHYPDRYGQVTWMGDDELAALLAHEPFVDGRVVGLSDVQSEGRF